LPPDDAMQILNVVELHQGEAFARELRRTVDDQPVDVPGDHVEAIGALLQTIGSQLRGWPS